MLQNGYQYALLLYKMDGTLLGQAPIAVDWEPAAEWTRFQALRRGLAAPAERRAASILPHVMPIWNSRRGEPYVRGFRLDLGAGDASDFDITYFQDLASAASSTLLERGELAAGDSYLYRAVAYPSPPSPADADLAAERPRAAFTAEVVIPPLDFRDGRLAAFTEESAPLGKHDTGAGAAAADISVFVPGALLDEVSDLTRRAGDRETGGILIGNLHRDPAAGDLFLEVTAQIPARHAEAELGRLSFLPADWTEVQAALDLRRQGEIMLGWWHCHLARLICKDCSIESQRRCRFATGTFSEHDRHLHRTVFPRAYSVALVVNDAATGLSHSMFGWRQGRVAARGFRVTNGDKRWQPPTDPSPRRRRRRNLPRSLPKSGSCSRA
jgi:hypothetical protein